jgi:phosphohistidine phosphatase
LRLYVVRHGIAEHRDTTRWPDDRDRPLTADGEDRFRGTARGLGKLVGAPGAVYSSPLVRAWQTAEILREEAGWPPPQEVAELEPGGTAKQIVEAIRVDEQLDVVAVVGHEPNLSEVVSHLLAGSSEALSIDLKKGGTICVETSGPPEPGSATLLWAIPPRVFRSL